ncbi:MAG: patatin-like phospholipase family protein [Bacteroidia bacterium]|nr:patatin-like phospholipase family protein [Bacteroidia bacterium]
MKKLDLGLALSGGGARCTAEIGVLKCLEENDIQPDIISGTSGGAIAGALFANGVSADEIFHFFKKVNLFSISNYAFRKPGFINIEKFRSLLHQYIPADNFEDLKIPLILNATDLAKGTITYFESGNLIECVLASAAYPGVFTPVKIDNNLYADGGILENLPTKPIRNKCKILIAVNVNAVVEIPISRIKTSFDVLNRALHLTISNQQNTSDCDILVEPKTVGSYGIFSITKMDEIYKYGYDEMVKNIPKVRSMMDQITRS